MIIKLPTNPTDKNAIVAFHHASNFLLDLIYPKFCLGCYRPDTYLCPRCIRTKLDLKPRQRCPICNKPSPYGATHTRCQTKYSINGIYAIASKNPLATKLITQLKYHFVTALIPDLIQLIYPRIPQQLQHPNLILPTPLHPSRERWRGFNQSHLIAQPITRYLNTQYQVVSDESARRRSNEKTNASTTHLPTKTTTINYSSHILIRTRQTTPQADISDRDQRQQNIKNVFNLHPNFPQQKLKNLHILLIDDVTTTGATLNQAAKPLKRAGAKSVWGLVFCR